MSKAVELAELHSSSMHLSCNNDVSESASFTFNVRQIEAFYHASRAEMANEILAEWNKPYEYRQGTFIERLRAMADREGK